MPQETNQWQVVSETPAAASQQPSMLSNPSWQVVSENPAPQQDYLSKTEDFISNAETGVTKGLGETVGTVAKGLNNIPFVGETLAPAAGIQALDKTTVSQNTGESVGKGIEGH